VGMGNLASSSIQQRNSHLPKADGGPKTMLHEETRHEEFGDVNKDWMAWRAIATAGSRGSGWEDVEGGISPIGDGEEEGMLEEGTLEEQICWERMPAFLREALAEGVRSVDAVGREVRGDGSLVGEGG
jgi:hypothetical protein